MKPWTVFSLLRAFLPAALLVSVAARLEAAATPVPHGTVTVISENQSVTPGRSFELGLHFQLEKGWHIYWLNPGDSGQPPRVAWNLPAGISAGEIEWPVPERIGTTSIMDFGYTDAVTLLVPMHASGEVPAQQPALIRGSLRVLVCREICVPGKAELSLSLPVSGGVAEPDPATRELFTAARKSLPKQAPADWKFRATDTSDNFILRANLGRRVTQAAFFPLMESQIDNAAPQNAKPTPQGFEMTLKKSDQLLKTIAQLKGVLALSPTEAFIIDAPVVSSGTGK